MNRKTLRWFLIGTAAAILALGGFVFVSADPRYQAQQILALGRYNRHNSLISEVANKHGLDPRLIKAVVWRESAFHSHKTGTSGERGLMQVGEAAANDWAKAHNVQSFVYTDLFDARTNLDVGTWYLKRALKFWDRRESPLPFALAEYNAGRKRAQRWAGTETQSAAQMLEAADIASTRRYVDDILKRYAYYQNQDG